MLSTERKKLDQQNENRLGNHKLTECVSNIKFPFMLVACFKGTYEVKSVMWLTIKEIVTWVTDLQVAQKFLRDTSILLRRNN